ncbi:MAG: cytochrome c [Sphingomicrobium sp.]
MRIAILAASTAAAFLGGCGGPETSQANNAQANISDSASPAAAANASTTTNGMAMIAAAPSKDRALKIMHDRHEAMEGLGKAMKTLHRALDSSPPDINVIRAQTALMASAAAKIPSWVPAGTGPDVGKTRAKPEIWTQHDLFVRKAKDYLAAAQAIDAAARTGDANKVMALHEDVDKACKACHDPFRAREH